MIGIRTGVAALLWLSLVVSSAAADESAEAAARAYADGEWAAAASGYEALVEANPDDARSRFRLAVSLRQLGRLEASSEQLDQAQAGGIPAAFVEPERARLRLAQGDRPGAVAALEAAAAAGFPNAASIESDDSFAPIADDPGFVAALDAIRRNGAPCEYDPRHRQFDFWIGQWDVRDQGGALLGRNDIEKAQKGCVLIERWSGATGGIGTSMNFFDAAEEEWVQVWASPTLQLEIRGGLEDGAMRLVGSVFYFQGGQQFPFRGTWTPLADGVVRQHFEQSADGGETWTTWFDGYYHPSAE